MQSKFNNNIYILIYLYWQNTMNITCIANVSFVTKERNKMHAK